MSALQFDMFSPRWSTENVLVRGPERTAYEDPFLATHRNLLETAGDQPMSFDEASWDFKQPGALGLDVESWQNFFLVCLLRFSDGKRLAFERSRRRDFDPAILTSVLQQGTLVTFNGNSYDLPIIALALAGADPEVLKQATNKIVYGNLKPWEVERELGVRVPRLNHIDLIEPNPSVRQGLKMLHARLHGRYLVDLPFDPEALLTPRQMNVATLYCFNDLDGTKNLYSALREPLELRVALGRRYELDLRSKSDAQIGEAIVKRRVEALSGRRLARPDSASALHDFRYSPPSFLEFESNELRRVLDAVRSTRFYLNGAGKVAMPDTLEGLKIKLGSMSYTMGIGGLHSTEAHRTLRSDERQVLLDVDVASQYPTIIKNLGLYPQALGPVFLEIYGEMIKERLAAKAAGDLVTSNGTKIALNGVYGKLGSPYSILYAPNLLIATTLTGQLAILMLIERAEGAGIPVVSANTDGVIFFCPRAKEDELKILVSEWEIHTGFSIEWTRYSSIHSSSVNTYIAIREDGKVKRKGPLADPWSEGDLRMQISKNPQMTITSEAAVRYLTRGESIEATVFGATDPRGFITIIKSTAGATWRGHHLGKIIRYYWSYDGSPIMSGKSKVSKSDGARPLLEMTDRVPDDVDRLKYCEETVKLLAELGVTIRG